MKRLILVVLTVGAVGLVWLLVARKNSALPEVAAIPSEQVIELAEVSPFPDVAEVNPQPVAAPPPTRPAVSLVRESVVAEPLPPVESTNPQPMDVLLSPHSSFEQRQAAWQQLRQNRKLDQAIAELEQSLTNHPTRAEYPAALGQAYLHKCATTQDVREQGILAMKADQVFDTALALDPANWEAGFFKAAALSNWPAEMNRGPEVIQRFTQLIEQQEAVASQPHFSQSYLWLGAQYRKSGRTDYADQVWQRGAALFPADEALRQKITAQP
jgi:tetratricopeptide (TPR) repeat protein